MRVVGTHDVAHNTGTLVERAVRAVAAVEHRVKHAAVDGLQAVTNVGQGAANDDGHCVVEVGPLHFGLQVHLLNSVRQHVAFKYGIRTLGVFRRDFRSFVTHNLRFPFQVYVDSGIFRQ